MSRPLRDTDPQKVHLITARTAGAELLLVPDVKLNQLLGGIVARYAELFEIEIYAYCFLSNHYHLLVRAPLENLSCFAECLNKEVAKRVNKLLSREGVFWGRRYDDQVAIEEMDALDGLLYVVTNPVKHGLVSDPKDWPGLTCYWQLKDEKPRMYKFFLHTEYRKALRRSLAFCEPLNNSAYEVPHELKLLPVPVFSTLCKRERVEKLFKLVAKRVANIVNERKQLELGFMGRRNVLKQPKRGTFPGKVSRSVRPKCYTRNPKALATFCLEERKRVESYKYASYRFRSGDLTVEFPKYTNKPPMHRSPKMRIYSHAPP